MDSIAYEPDVHLAVGVGPSLLAGSANESERPWGVGVAALLDAEIEKRVERGLFLGLSARYQYMRWIGCGECGPTPSSNMPELLLTAAYEFSTLRTSHGPRLGFGGFWNHTISPLSGTAESQRTVFYGTVLNIGYFVFAKRLGVFAGGAFQMLSPSNISGEVGLYGFFGVVGASFGGVLLAK